MSKLVLVVDDSAFLRRQVRAALDRGGFDAIEAEDGSAALEQLSRATDIALVVCDIPMPKMSGRELVQELARAPEHQRVPCLVLTASSDPYQLERARGAGARAWMLKPVDGDKLLATVQRLLAVAA